MQLSERGRAAVDEKAADGRDKSINSHALPRCSAHSADAAIVVTLLAVLSGAVGRVPATAHNRARLCRSNVAGKTARARAASGNGGPSHSRRKPREWFPASGTARACRVRPEVEAELGQRRHRAQCRASRRADLRPSSPAGPSSQICTSASRTVSVWHSNTIWPHRAGPSFTKLAYTRWAA